MSEFQKFAIAFLVICGVILTGGFSFKFGRKIGYNNGYNAGKNEPHPADTVYRVDTIVFDHPVPVIKEKIRTELLPIRDTLRLTDTLYMALEIERRTYAGDDYRAVVSGWHPSLDEITVYPKTITITQTVPAPAPPRVGFAVTAGPGAVWNGKTIAGGLGVVAGLSVRFGK